MILHLAEHVFEVRTPSGKVCYFEFLSLAQAFLLSESKEKPLTLF